MLRLKKAASPRTELRKHDNQDTRVTVDGKDSKNERGAGSRFKRFREAVEAFVIRQILLELWENRLEYWEIACDVASKILEAIGS